MLKISKSGTANQFVILKLEGQVVGPWVEELGRVCEPLLDEGRGLKLDLCEVSFVDREGVALLLELKNRKVSLEGCSPFVSEELKTVAS